MLTGSGTYDRTKFIRPSLDTNLRPLERPIVIAIQSWRTRHAPFGKLRAEKAINGDGVRHWCVVCRNVSIRGPNGGKNCGHYFQGGYWDEIWLQKKQSRFNRSVILRSWSYYKYCSPQNLYRTLLLQPVQLFWIFFVFAFIIWIAYSPDYCG